LKSEIMSSGQR